MDRLIDECRRTIEGHPSASPVSALGPSPSRPAPPRPAWSIGPRPPRVAADVTGARGPDEPAQRGTRHEHRPGPRRSVEPSGSSIGSGDLEVEDRRAEALAVRIERQRAGDPAAQRAVEDEVQRPEPRQRVADDLAPRRSGEVLLHPLGRDVPLQQRIVAPGRTRSPRCSTCRPCRRSRVGDLAQLHVRSPRSWTDAGQAPAARGPRRPPTTSRADFQAPPPPAGPFVYSVSTSLPMRTPPQARRPADHPDAHLGRARASGRQPRAVHGVDADQVEADLVGRHAGQRQPLPHDLERPAAPARPRPDRRRRSGPRRRYPSTVADRHLQRAGRGRPVAARDRDAVGARLRQRHRAKVRHDVGLQVARPGHGSRRGAAPCRSPRVTRPPEPGDLGDDGRAVLADLGHREAQPGQVGHVLAAGIGEVAAGDLAGALEQVADDRALPEPVPVVQRPAELVDERAPGTGRGRRPVR